eukprot:gnl/Spiro4/25758_TR12813_c0_g1_i1.p1 gnl/Spiro4/25758_TR12813_c0_g1~~gnl/Spiro4/25758_TR12813_c0_g1_i1.p1  ORF type:complete len:427 (-),score=121.72 gnl/Spiro4/25758_TR12813_c0_g1_i1:89-1306(-)
MSAERSGVELSHNQIKTLEFLYANNTSEVGLTGPALAEVLRWIGVTTTPELLGELMSEFGTSGSESSSFGLENVIRPKTILWPNLLSALKARFCDFRPLRKHEAAYRACFRLDPYSAGALPVAVLRRALSHAGICVVPSKGDYACGALATGESAAGVAVRCDDPVAVRTNLVLTETELDALLAESAATPEMFDPVSRQLQRRSSRSLLAMQQMQRFEAVPTCDAAAPGSADVQAFDYWRLAFHLARFLRDRYGDACFNEVTDEDSAVIAPLGVEPEVVVSEVAPPRGVCCPRCSCWSALPTDRFCANCGSALAERACTAAAGTCGAPAYCMTCGAAAQPTPGCRGCLLREPSSSSSSSSSAVRSSLVAGAGVPSSVPRACAWYCTACGVAAASLPRFCPGCGVRV